MIFVEKCVIDDFSFMA